jgi:hypothetical protein
MAEIGHGEPPSGKKLRRWGDYALENKGSQEKAKKVENSS